MSERDDARDAILARRRRFLAMALAGAGIAAGAEACREPQPCLSIAIPPDAEPEPCLSVVDPGPREPVDAGSDTGGADAGAAGSATAHHEDAGRPMPCLKPVLRDAGPPRVCLSIAPPMREPPEKGPPNKGGG